MNKKRTIRITLVALAIIALYIAVGVVYAQTSDDKAPVEWRVVWPIYPEGFRLYWVTTTAVEFTGFNVYRDGIQVNMSMIPCRNVPEAGVYYIFNDYDAVAGDEWVLEMVFNGYSLWSNPLVVNRFGRILRTPTPMPTPLPSPLTPPPSPLGVSDVVIRSTHASSMGSGSIYAVCLPIACVLVGTAIVLGRRKKQ